MKYLFYDAAPNNAMQPTGFSVPLVEDLDGSGVVSRRLMAGVGLLRVLVSTRLLE